MQRVRDISGQGTPGYTLIELMGTLMILAVMVGLSMPNFSRFGANAQLESSISALESSLRIAHSLTKMGNNQVTICASTNASTCSGTNEWEKGWVVFYDDGSGGGNIIASVATEQIASLTIRASGFDNNHTIELEPMTALRVGFEEGTFTGCLKGGTIKAHALITHSDGFIREALDSAGDTDDDVEDHEGNNVTCPT